MTGEKYEDGHNDMNKTGRGERQVVKKVKIKSK